MTRILIALGASCVSLTAACGTSPSGDPDASPTGTDAKVFDAGADAIDTPDADSLSCLTGGSGQVNGTVMGRSLAPVRSAHYEQALPLDLWILTIDKAEGFCSPVGAGDDYLAVYFECGTVEPGTYQLTGVAGCAGPMTAYARFENRQTGPLDLTIGGSMIITEVEPCVIGTFTASFGSGSLSGSFNAVSCL